MSPRARHIAGIAIFCSALGVAVPAALVASGVWQRAGLPVLRPADVQGDWFAGDFSSQWQGWLRHGEVVRIREQATGVDQATGSRLEYLFTDDRLTGLRWPDQALVTDPVALAAVMPHAQALVRQAHLHRSLSPPTLDCYGNVPFWHLHLAGAKARFHRGDVQTAQSVQQRDYEGRWKYLAGSDNAPGIEWLGALPDSPLATLRIRIEPGMCLDAMASVKKYGPFSYRASLILGDSLRSGCCRSVHAGH